MTATTHKWLCHFEYPHSWHDLKTETISVMHDRYFGITLLFLGLAILAGALMLLAMLGSGSTTPTMGPNYWYYWPNVA